MSLNEPVGLGPTNSFTNLRSGGTTTNFDLTAGYYKFGLRAVDPNCPGIATVQDVNNANAAMCSVNTTEGPIIGGVAYFQVPPGGGTYNINVTQQANLVYVEMVV